MSMIDELTSPHALSDLLDRARATMIRAMDALESDSEMDARLEAFELIQQEFEGVDTEDHTRAEALISTLQQERDERQRVINEEMARAAKRTRERTQTPEEKANRVTLFGLLLHAKLRIWPGTSVNDSLWGRVWAKVKFPSGEPREMFDPCWLWTGALSKKRRSLRGVIQLAGRGSRVVIVCRLICEWFHGPAPTEKHEAGHTCPKGEEALCCNPTHLRWMTREENEQHKHTYAHPSPVEEAPFR